MDNKEDILERIDKGIVMEEDAVIFYAKQIESYIPESYFSEEQQKKVIKLLEVLKNQSEAHKKNLEVLRKKVENA